MGDGLCVLGDLCSFLFRNFSEDGQRWLLEYIAAVGEADDGGERGDAEPGTPLAGGTPI